MKPRLSFSKTAPDAYQAMLAQAAPLKTSSLEPKLKELVKIRASQMNACAYCLNMHMEEARKLGETDDRIILLDAWRETPLYSDRERAALAWAEALTDITNGHAPDEVYEDALRHFSETELAHLSLLIVNINSWNRLMVAFRTPPKVKTAAAA